MDQPVAEGNDPATVANTFGKVRVQPEGLIKGFSDDFELSLYRRPQESVSRVGSEGFPAGELSEQVTRLSDIEQVLAYFKRQHKAALGSFRWPAENRDCESDRVRPTQPARQKAAPGLLAVQSNCRHAERGARAGTRPGNRDRCTRGRTGRSLPSRTELDGARLGCCTEPPDPCPFPARWHSCS